MAIFVQRSAFSVIIKNVYNQRFIGLSHHEWLFLAEAKFQIDRLVQQKGELSWTIGQNVLVYTELFGDDIRVHIRNVDGDPAYAENVRGGLAMYVTEWDCLKEQLPEMSKETDISIQVLTDMIHLKIKGMMQAECFGCRHNHPSHICLMHDPMDAHIFFNRAMKKIKEIDFILFLAQEAWKKDHIIQAPSETFRRVTYLFETDVQKNVESRFW